MKKLVLSLIVIVVAVIAGYMLFFKKDIKPVEKKDQSLSVSKPSDAFDAAFALLMSDYYAVKDGLVDWDTAAADLAATSLRKHADSLPLKILQADSSVVETALNYASSISSEAAGFIGEKTIEQKRRALNMMTDEIYNLVRTVRYDGSIIYHIKCPMAFNDSEEAYWLSNSNAVVNPYLGRKHPKYNSKMVGCGEIVDSLDFVKH